MCCLFAAVVISSIHALFCLIPGSFLGSQLGPVLTRRLSSVTLNVFYFVIALGASYKYFQLKYVRFDVVKILIPASIVGVLIGVVVGHHLPRDIMTLILGIFLLCIAVALARRKSHTGSFIETVTGAGQALSSMGLG